MPVDDQDADCNWKETFQKLFDTKVKNVYM